MSTTPPEFPDPKRPRLIQSMAAAYPPPPSSAEKLPCPRCNSTATKFCYYNNYNLSQPRHFCRDCRRYWTYGGTLRDVPVGGGTRKKPRLSLQLRASPSNSSGSPSSSSLTHETKPASDSAVEKPDLPSNQTQLQLLNLNDNVGSETGLPFSSMMMMNSQEQPGFLSLGGYGYVYSSGYGSGFVHGFQQGYGYGAGASGVDFPAEIVYGAPVAASSGFDMNTWQMAVSDHGGQGGGLVNWPEVQILNSMPAVNGGGGGGALKEEKVADSSTRSCLDFPAF